MRTESADSGNHSINVTKQYTLISTFFFFTGIGGCIRRRYIEKKLLEKPLASLTKLPSRAAHAVPPIWLIFVLLLLSGFRDEATHLARPLAFTSRYATLW